MLASSSKCNQVEGQRLPALKRTGGTRVSNSILVHSAWEKQTLARSPWTTLPRSKTPRLASSCKCRHVEGQRQQTLKRAGGTRVSNSILVHSAWEKQTAGEESLDEITKEQNAKGRRTLVFNSILVHYAWKKQMAGEESLDDIAKEQNAKASKLF
eukprot:gene15841-21967_t